MEKRFIVTDHNYINTGGNCMVSIFAVYDSTDNVSRFVIANEDGFNWQTADTISSELQLDSDELIKKIVLGSWKWDALVSDPSWDMHQFTEDEFELFKYCQFEYIKKDAAYFSIQYRLSISELPNELYNKLSADYREWADREGVGALTDGYDVFMDDNYTPPVVQDDKPPLNEKDLKEMKEFYKWYEDLKYFNELRDRTAYITIAVAGNSVKIPFHADSYELLDRFLTKAIEEY